MKWKAIPLLGDSTDACTMEPLNKGHLRDHAVVLSREVVLFQR